MWQITGLVAQARTDDLHREAAAARRYLAAQRVRKSRRGSRLVLRMAKLFRSEDGTDSSGDVYCYRAAS